MSHPLELGASGRVRRFPGTWHEMVQITNNNGLRLQILGVLGGLEVLAVMGQVMCKIGQHVLADV